MRSLRNPLAGVAVLAVTLSLIAAGGPAAGANTLLTARARQSSTGCVASTTTTTVAGYAACAPSSADNFTEITASTTVPDIPVCNECNQKFRKATAGVILSNMDIKILDRVDQAPMTAADGVYIVQHGRKNTYGTWWSLNTAMGLNAVKTVTSGTPITATVQSTGSQLVFTVDAYEPNGVLIKKKSFTVTRSCAGCTFATAEWAVGANPTGTGTNYPLPSSGRWPLISDSFQTASGSGTIKTFLHARLTMVDASGNVLVEPGPLNPPGNAFTDVFRKSF
jgi:hypothetical protein